MRRDRADIRAGVHLEGGNFPVTQLVPPKRDQIEQGMLLHGGVIFNKSADLPRSEPAPFAEVGARMDSLKNKLEQLAAVLRQAKQT